MIFPIKDDFRWRTNFNQLRPLSLPLDQRNRFHAAADWACPVGTTIYAPEGGQLFYQWIEQPANGSRECNIIGLNQKWWPFSRYFERIFGGVIVLKSENYIHAFCHIDKETILDFLKIFKIKEPRRMSNGFTIYGNIHSPSWIAEGSTIGVVGNSGMSTGPHTHYELHNHTGWTPHIKRPNPEDLYPSVWQQHKHEVLEAKKEAYIL